MSAGGFCTDCGHRVVSFDGLTPCPKCGTTNIPCHDDNQVTVSINWHELHILVVWAENWQRLQNLGRTVYGIAARIADQHPEHNALTFAGEIAEISKHYEVQVTDPHLRRDIAEQTGQEVGLHRLPEA
jgi:hypothetical protein